MTLAEYLAEAKLTDEAFAKKVEISRPMVTKLRARQVYPSSQLAERILAESDNRISFAELLPAAALPADPMAMIAKAVA